MDYERDRSRDNFRLLTAFGMIFVLFALFLGRETVWKPCREAVASRAWRATPAVVVSGRVEAVPRSGRPVFRIDYRYGYDGVNYGSTRYGFFPDSMPEEADGLLPLLTEFPAGKKIICYVDPASPLEAVLNRDIPLRYYIHAAVVLVTGILGVWLFIYAVRARRRERRCHADCQG
ncbi:MAG: DUF3592 domain-containing protein [Lentisphaeria bacterium]|nr:DUF3592 domain-containing protein [Lentisphaeria bacterium]